MRESAPTPVVSASSRHKGKGGFALSGEGSLGTGSPGNIRFVGLRTVDSRPPKKQTWFKPGMSLPDEGAHSISLSFLKVPSLPAFLTARRLRSLTSVTMPRKHKNKSHAHGKRHQVQGEAQEPQASAAAAPGEERPSSPSSVPQGSPPSSPASGDPQELQGAMAPSCPDAGPSCAGSDEGAQGPEEESEDAAQSALVVRSFRRDPLNRKASMLVEFLLEKYNKKEPITQNALKKVISSKYKEHFPEILRRASERVELVFGLELKEVDCSRNIYALINKFSLGAEEGSRGERGMPKSGLLMALLGIIFMKGNRATEEEVWDFLSVLGIYDGRNHSIFGEPRKLITKDLVEKGYLIYRRVSRRDPPSYEFLWGPRAYAETSKMKVLEVLAKIQDTVPSSFPDLFHEALRDQVQRAGLRGAAIPPPMAKASAPSRAKSCSSSHI
ncbi:melanoma-associated antigen B4-like [Muntiacus reevesi]